MEEKVIGTIRENISEISEENSKSKNRRKSSRDFMKILLQMGLTPEQVIKIVQREEERKRKVREYQKKNYYKVSVMVRKDDVQRIAQLSGVDENKVRKYLGCLKLMKGISQEEVNRIQEALEVKNP